MVMSFLAKQATLTKTCSTLFGLSVRHCSKVPVKRTKLAPLLTLREVDQGSFTQNSAKFIPKHKPLVIVFEWLYANQNALNKYCELYHDIGLDVLTVRGKLVHFLWPPRGEIFARTLLNYLLNERPRDEQIFIHAFSVGAYNYTICETLALESYTQFGSFRDKVIGQVFDSIVIGTYENMSTGIAAALHDSGVLTKPIIAIMDAYYKTTNKKTKEVYDKLVQNFKEDPVVVPTLMYFSHNDPMCHVPTMTEMVSDWNNKFPQFDVTVKSWEESIHAAHLKFHKEEYLVSWWELINKVIQNKQGIKH
ncbi:uncharacterized protein LOC143071154 [Mytilus galloprovincialis]|uniref:uncharacterized protein LOC143071154 n=1 Tax=Mytilus galloprovincialis TaxID=29158 RepID=UPI003F7C371A